MKVIITFLMTFVFSVAFAAYAEENGNEVLHNLQLNDIVSDSSGSKSTPKIRKRLLSGGEEGYERNFTYINDSIRTVNGEKISYSDSIITIGDNFYGIYYLKDGLIKNYVQDNYYLTTFKYENGRLVSITDTYQYNDTTYNGTIINKGTISSLREFTWKDDVIVHQQQYYEEDGILKLRKDYYFEYDTVEDYGGVCAFIHSDDILFDDLPEELVIQGYFGQLPKYLVRSSFDTLPDGNGMNKFDYILDSDGYPVYMSRTYNNGRSSPFYFSWETLPDIHAESISLSQDFWSGKAGESFYLSATVLPEDNDDTLLWESSDESIAIVNNDGKVTAISAGETTIKVICGDVSASCKVSVLATPVESVALSPESWSGKAGESFSIVATVSPKDATNKKLTWTTTDASVATVDSNGYVTTIKPGKVDIIAKSNDGTNITAVCHLDVYPVLVQSISLSPYSKNCLPGDTFTITANVLPSNASDKTLSWVSSDDNIAKVDKDGNVTAVTAGNAIITASSLDGSNIGAICNVTVSHIQATSLSLNMSEWKGKVGETVTLKATILPENATDKTVIWSSGNSSVASVDENGNVTALEVGSTDITARCGEIYDICKVTIVPTSVESITMSQTTAELKVGESVTISATVIPKNATDRTVVWTSDNPAVSTVDESGKVSAISLGTASIKASCGDVSAACVVTVVATPVESITMSQTTAELKVGESVSLSSNVFPENATDKTVIWSSDGPTVASVDENGTVTALSAGYAVIHVMSTDNPKVSAICLVTVLPVLVESIQLTPDNWSGEEGQSFNITATILPENATDKTLLWSSSNETIAKVDDFGQVSILKEGNCVITATASDGSGIYAECIVTGLAGIDEIFSESDIFDVYDLNGIMIKKNSDRENLKLLTPGIYIIRIGNSMKKVVIR